MAHAYAAHHAATEALKASGVFVRVEPGAFLSLLGRADDPLVVVSREGVFSKRYRYLTSYKGLAFYTTSPTMLPLPKAEVIAAKSISVPST